MAPGTQTLIVVAGMFFIALGLVAYGLAKVFAPGDPTLERVNTYALVPQSLSRRG
ncbi:MAG: hypothetical protein IIC78_13265 [Chloroflexi bacterium]|nr:hypothetical protein [Chloroflexota bacterium]